MKILIIDTESFRNIGGHFDHYFKNIILPNNEYVFLLANNNADLSHKQYIFEEAKADIILKKNKYFKKLSAYVKFVRLINKIIAIEKPDICHFLTGDFIFKFAGIGLKYAKKRCKVLITFHQIRTSRLRNIFRKIMFKNISMGVVHTVTILETLKRQKIFNVAHIEYPCFEGTSELSVSEAKEYWNLPADIPVLGVLGGTRHDKGLDILLEALKNVTVPFHLLIAGKEEDIKEDYINKAIVSYKDKVKMCLKILSDEEFKNAVMASDFIVLPYRKIFNGASGPLVDGVITKKTIIGPSHGSVAGIIKDNHIGYTFESENVNDLANVLNHALANEFYYDDAANKYVEYLNPVRFRKEYADLYKKLMNERNKFV